MLKKNTLIFLTLLLSVFVLASSPVLAQKTNPTNTQIQNVETEIWQKYLKILTLSTEQEKREFFIKSSPDDKSALMKFHQAMFLAKRPEFTKEQKEIILEGIALATPEQYAPSKDGTQSKQQVISFVQRAQMLFSKKEVGEIFAGFSGDAIETEMLRKYQEFSSLGFTDKRKEYFRKLSPQDKNALWRINLVLNLVKRPTMTDLQKELILDALTLLTPEFFSMPVKGSEWKGRFQQRFEVLAKKIINTFSKDEVIEIFARLGNAVPSTLIEDPGVDLPVAGSCECNLDSLYQCGWYYCTSGTCSKTNTGCGLFWAFECNGRCPRAS